MIHNNNTLMVQCWLSQYSFYQTGEVFTGHIHFDTDGEIKPPNFDENSEWKCVFIQSTSSARMLKPNTEFLYCKLFL